MKRKTTKDKPVAGDPTYISGVQAGWSDNAGRFLSKDGRFCTRDKAIEYNSATNKDLQGGFVKYKTIHPITSQFEILETTMFNGDTDAPMSGFAGVLNAVSNSATTYKNRMAATYDAGVKKWEADRSNKMLGVQGFDKTPEGKPMPNFMPVQIQTRLSLSEHYYNTDGDAANVVDVPIELISRKIDVICTDTKLRDEIQQFILDKNLEPMVSELWSTMREYGQAYPFEVWDDPDNPKDLINIVPLPPKSVHIGYYWSYALGADYAGATTWSESLMQSVFPPAMFRILQRHWNDSPMYEIPAGGVLITGDNLRPLFDKRRSWMRYSMPMIVRGMRELVDRTVYQDSVRALIEGYKYQLWVIKLGDADHVPLPEEIAAVKSMVTDISGDKTGMFVWRDAPFTVEIHAPKGLQEMISNDYYGGITKEFLRKMGITSQVIDGETPGTLGASGGRGSAADKSDLNVQLFFERSRYQSRQILDWLGYIVKKWVRQNSLSKKLSTKALDTLSFEFAPTHVEMAGRIAEIYGPMYRDGALSHHTYVGAAGMNGDVELKYKETETKARDDGLLNPPVTFAQMVVGGEGGDKKVSQTEPRGSPDKAGEQNNDLSKGEGTPFARQPIHAAFDAQVLLAQMIEMQAKTAQMIDVLSKEAQRPINVNATFNQPASETHIHQPEQPINNNITVAAAPTPDVTVNLPQMEQRINVEPAAVHVAQPDVTLNVSVPAQEPPVVNVAAAEVVVPAPVVNVTQPEINITNPVTVEAAQINLPEQATPNIVVNQPDIHVHVPEQTAPNITVEAPNVTIENSVSPTPVNVQNEIVLPEKDKKKVEFQYDRDGNITGAKEV